MEEKRSSCVTAVFGGSRSSDSTERFELRQSSACSSRKRSACARAAAESAAAASAAASAAAASAASSRAALAALLARAGTRGADANGATATLSGASIAACHHARSSQGRAPRKASSPWRSPSRPRPIGVPLTPHRWTPCSARAISAALAVEDSTSCASSSTMRHHVSESNGEQSSRARLSAAAPPPRIARSDLGWQWASSCRRFSKVVSSRSYRASAAGRSAASLDGCSAPGCNASRTPP